MAERFTEVVNLRQQSLSTGAAQGFLSLADQLEGFKQIQQQRAEDKAIQRGIETAGQIELEKVKVDGKEVTVAPEKKKRRFIGSIEIDSHNKALRSAYLASLNNDNRETIANLATENANDLAKFNEAAEGYRKGVLATVDPAARQVVNEDLDNKITSARIRVQENVFKQQKIQANAERTKNIESASGAAFRASRNGDRLEAAEALQEAFVTIDSMVESGDLKADKAAEMRREIERETAEQGIRKEFDDLVDLEGFDAAFDRLEERSKKVPKGWTPDEWDSYIASQQADLNRKVARTTFNDKEKQKEIDAQFSVERGRLFTDPSIPADPAKNSQDRKDVNAAYLEDSRAWQGLPVQQQVDNNVEFIKNTGIVPDQVISGINAAMRSGSPEQVSLMADLVGRIEELPNAANALRDLPDESRALSRQIADSVRSGIDLGPAIEIARKNTFGLTEQQRELIKINTQAVAKELPAFLLDQVDKAFDPSPFLFFIEEPDVPPTMQADYNVAFKKFMILNNGNSEQARELAFGSLRKIWAVTEVGGANRFMKFAPEAFYAVEGFDNDWMDRQFMAEMEERGILGAQLTTDFNTGRSNTPTYPVAMTNEQGVPDIIMNEKTGRPLTWKPDFTLTEEFLEIQAAPGKAVKSAKKKRKEKLVQRANDLRRKVIQTLAFNNNLARGGIDEFISSPEGIDQISETIVNLFARKKITETELNELQKAFEVQ